LSESEVTRCRSSRIPPKSKSYECERKDQNRHPAGSPDSRRKRKTKGGGTKRNPRGLDGGNAQGHPKGPYKEEDVDPPTKVVTTDLRTPTTNILKYAEAKDQGTA